MMAIAALLATSSSVNATLYASGGPDRRCSPRSGSSPRSSGASSRLGCRRPAGHRGARPRRRERRRPVGDRVGRQRLLAADLPARRRSRGFTGCGHETALTRAIVLLGIAATAVVLVFFAIDTIRNAPETFVAIVAIAVLAVVLDFAGAARGPLDTSGTVWAVAAGRTVGKKRVASQCFQRRPLRPTRHRSRRARAADRRPPAPRRRAQRAAGGRRDRRRVPAALHACRTPGRLPDRRARGAHARARVPLGLGDGAGLRDPDRRRGLARIASAPAQLHAACPADDRRPRRDRPPGRARPGRARRSARTPTGARGARRTSRPRRSTGPGRRCSPPTHSRARR